MITPDKVAFSRSLYIAVLRKCFKIIFEILEKNSGQDAVYEKEEVSYNLNIKYVTKR